MAAEERKVWVVGHRNPDTDSICAAISYAHLKNETETGTYLAKRAGTINEETRYVLDCFGVEEPELVTYAGAQLKDITIRRTAGVNSRISLKCAWERMKEMEVVTLPVTGAGGKLKGIIVTKDIATSCMDEFDKHALANSNTLFKTIAETIKGEVCEGNEHGRVQGKVVVAASDLVYLEEDVGRDDVVIIGDRVDAQLSAIRSNAGCIIVCGGYEVDEEVKKLAGQRGCVIITTPFDTFAVARCINQSMPIRQYMTKEGLITFAIDDYVNDVKEMMTKVRHRDFPVLDENGRYAGMVSRRNLMSMQKKQVILVDHNERSQAVEGIGEAEILEIIDHHRLGALETVSPVYFRNQPLGCTSTIIYQMYLEKAVEIPKQIAGLLLSAILSDTLMFRSPTCTASDREAAEQLARIAEVEIEEHAKNMFRAGSDFKHKTTEEIVYQDFKIFHADDCEFGVAQVSVMSREELEQLSEQLKPQLTQVLGQKKLDMVYMMLTDILEESSKLIFAGRDAGRILAEAYRREETPEGIWLPGVVSRKKQLIPALMNVLAEL